MQDIASFTQSKGVAFRIMQKINVNGPEASLLFQWLTEQHADLTPQAGTGRIGWNFAKFLIDRNGALRARFPTQVPPQDIAAFIDTLLNEQEKNA